MARRRFTDKDRARIFTANKGCCHLCDGKIDVAEAWEVEHVIAWELTRDDSDGNLRPAHIKCHQIKTHKQDRPAINQAKRREAKHKGFSKPAGKLRGPAFQKSAKTPQIDKSALPTSPRRNLFQRLEQS
ncbi:MULTISPECIES: HNH endonuclease signature motif containing protein [unclassified Mesorhizobium]|uniref:HNH endonuclease n=1 Tax=unclassified Mesorhizobium TaxID=325217 RepID=UPI0015E46EEC|nr:MULTISPECIES: HNH endonuclease signature motif containing protein [unclassified Mesorhizobium]